MHQFKPVGDVASLGGIVAIMGGWLPSIAALLAVIWWLIRIYETKTVQRWFGRESKTADE
jgi:chromate transport protein ChrA